MDFQSLTIKDAVKGLITKKWSCVDLTKASLEIIETTEKMLNAFITLDKKGAIKQAELSDRLLQSNPEIHKMKPLLGIPIALKDIYSTKGIKTTAASSIIKDYVPPYDATATLRLKEAGAVLIGKTNLDAWAHGSSGENSEYGPAHNPYNLKYVPGGSSSGSAASVGAGQVLASGGTDTGGSIRLPASFCNVVGIKPTYGRVSRYGIIAMASSLDTIGHFTKTIEDNALILGITAGKDLYDATTSETAVQNYIDELKKPVKSMKVAIPKEYFENLHPDVEKITRETIAVLEKKGVKFSEISLSHTSNAIGCYYIICPAEVASNLARFDGVRYGGKRSEFGPEAKRRTILGTYTLSAGYADEFYKKGAKIRAVIQKDYAKALEAYDAIITPVSPTPPFKLGERTNDPVQMYLSDMMTVSINIAGVPAISVPAGFSNGLPVGVQFIGGNFREDILYRLGYALESETACYKVRPTFKK